MKNKKTNKPSELRIFIVGVIFLASLFTLAYFVGVWIYNYTHPEVQTVSCPHVYNLSIRYDDGFWMGNFDVVGMGHDGHIIMGSRKSKQAIVDAIYTTYCE